MVYCFRAGHVEAGCQGYLWKGLMEGMFQRHASHEWLRCVLFINDEMFSQCSIVFGDGQVKAGC